MASRILVVDDDEVIRMALQNVLERDGHDVVEANDGKEAIKLMDQGAFDVVITDILMPERDGLETLMHAKKAQPGVKVIVMSAAENTLHLHNARGLGAELVFAKPFELGDIVAAVNELTST